MPYNSRTGMWDCGCGASFATKELLKRHTGSTQLNDTLQDLGEMIAAGSSGRLREWELKQKLKRGLT